MFEGLANVCREPNTNKQPYAGAQRIQSPYHHQMSIFDHTGFLEVFEGRLADQAAEEYATKLELSTEEREELSDRLRMVFEQNRRSFKTRSDRVIHIAPETMNIVLDRSVGSFFSDYPELFELGQRLEAAGCLRVGDLVQADLEALIEKIKPTAIQRKTLESLLRSFGLRFGMRVANWYAGVTDLGRSSA